MVYRTKTGSGFRIFVGWQISLAVVGLAFIFFGLASLDWASLTVGSLFDRGAVSHSSPLADRLANGIRSWRERTRW